MNGEVAHLVEQRMMASDSSDDKLGMFRQQAAIVAKKKEAAAEKLQDMQQQLQQIKDDLAVCHDVFSTTLPHDAHTKREWFSNSS